ncbi:UNVERIFIED_CONTAM: hypothetical protein GTU68_044833, partial [Idotea baltica]|nr:hypothetical protein [Idotea baltica]
EGVVGGALVATQLADLTSVITTCEDGVEEKVGGLVKQLAWDPKSERLAVLFKDSSFIALFHTYTHPQLHLAPGGFIRGESGQIPLHISFQSNVSNGSILTTVWSGGEVKHLPLRYTTHEPHETIAPLPLLNRSLFAPPTPLNQSRLLNVSLGPTSPLGSPLPRLFTSPT